MSILLLIIPSVFCQYLCRSCYWEGVSLQSERVQGCFQFPPEAQRQCTFRLPQGDFGASIHWMDSSMLRLNIDSWLAPLMAVDGVRLARAELQKTILVNYSIKINSIISCTLSPISFADLSAYSTTFSTTVYATHLVFSFN